MSARDYKDRIIIRCKGKDFEGWEQSTVEMSLESIAGTASIPITWDSRLGACPIKRQDEVAIFIRAGLGPSAPETQIAKGFVLAAEPFYDAHNMGRNIAVRDSSGDLVHCSAIHKGGQWRGAKADRIIKDLLAPFGIELIVQADVGAAIKDFKLEHGETVVDAASKVARLRGLLVTRDHLGRVVLTTAGKDKFVGSLRGGRAAKTRGGNVISMQGQGTDENRFSDYFVYGQGAAKGAADFDKQRTQKHSSHDPEIKRYLPLVINAGNDSDGTDVKQLAEHTARVRRGQAYAYEYKVDGWTVRGKPWLPNLRVPIYDDEVGLDGDEWLITSVKLHHDLQDGQVTTLVVKPIEAYAPEPLKSQQIRPKRKPAATKGAR